MRSLFGAFLCCLVLVLVGCGSKAVPLPNPDKAGERIVGIWEVTKSGSYTPAGAIYDFGKDGKLKVTSKIDDKETSTDWTYNVDGDRINLVGPESAKELLKIKKLTDGELITEDATGETGIVTGFTYTSNINVKSVLIAKPLRGGQNKFEVVFGDKSFPLLAGKRFYFTSVVPEGVSKFVIRGIEESENLVYEPGEIERTRTPRPTTDRPFGHHHRGSFPTGMNFVKEGKPEVLMVPILKQSPTEYRRKQPASPEKTAGT